MWSMSRFLVIVIAACAAMCLASPSWGTDYNSRFIRNYPPGYHGMWYNAQRFHETNRENKNREEFYTWDKFMGHLTGVTFPFLPVPHDWDYGTWCKFNLPDYNTNDWR
jgi:hypothetical protein